MGRAFLTISFMVVLLWWLRYELKKKVSLKKYWKWFVAALLLQAISSIISLLVPDRVVGNFFYHAIGGGMTTTLLYVYLMKTYGLTFSWRVELVLLYCFVSALGVINELAEYAGEFAIRVGLFSWDSHDTWRDLAANTSGAVIAWLIYKACTTQAKRVRISKSLLS
jgi:hypothetical protein